MTQSSFYVDGETYSTATVTSNDTPGSATPSQAPSSFFQSGGIYNALAEESATLTLFQQLLASTQAAQAAAAASASAAAASAASVPSASATNPLQAGTAAPGTAATYSRGDHVHPTDTSRAPTASPTFTGTMTIPSAAPTAAGAIGFGASINFGDGSANHALAGVDLTQTLTNKTIAFASNTLTGVAPLASPALTGTPTSPTAASGTNTTQLATTAFVTTALTPLRQKAASDYYVATTGSDTLNNGLSSGAPFATIQKAITLLGTLDMGGQSVTVHVADGSYTAGFSLTAPFVGGNVQVLGNTTTPANCTITVASSGNVFEVANPGTVITVSGFKMVASASSSIACYAHDMAKLVIAGKMEFGLFASGSHISAARSGQVQISNGVSYTITGNANFHYNASADSTIIANVNSVTVPSGTTVAFSVFCQLASCSVVQIVATTYTTTGATVTGTKNAVSSGAGVDSQGSFAINAAFPGSVAGTTTSPGWWT